MAWKQARESPRPPRSDTFNPGKASAKAKRPGYLSVMRAASDTRSSLSLSLSTLWIWVCSQCHTHTGLQAVTVDRILRLHHVPHASRCTDVPNELLKMQVLLWTMLRTCYLSPCLTLTQCLGCSPTSIAPGFLDFGPAGYHSSYENLYVHGLQSIGVLVTFLFGRLSCKGARVFGSPGRTQKKSAPQEFHSHILWDRSCLAFWHAWSQQK